MLYIEDNLVNVILVEELFALRPGVTLRCAVDGAWGVSKALLHRPDVVLIDIGLPDFDGFEVRRCLRAEPALDGSALIALWANTVAEDIARASAAGFDDDWTKPIDFKRFLGALDSLFARLRLGQTSRYNTERAPDPTPSRAITGQAARAPTARR